MADQPAVMISDRVLSHMAPRLEALGCRVVRRWELADADKAAVRAIVQLGGEPLSRERVEALPNLGLIACISVGYDGVDVPWCRGRGVEVTHAHALNAEDCADHALGLLIGSWRNVVSGDRLIRAGEWTENHRGAFRPGLKGRKVGVVGLGAIGEAAAVRCEAFGMSVAWWGPNPKPARWPRAASLLDLARDSDILLVACRADDANRGLISREVIEAVGPRGLIVNVARGSVVDEDALIAALKDGRLGRAALDVFEAEPTPVARWADVPNAVLTPHTAGGTVEAVPLMIDQAVENVRRFLAGEPLASPVAS